MTMTPNGQWRNAVAYQYLTQKLGIMLSEIWNPDTRSFEPAPWATPGGGGGDSIGRCQAALEGSDSIGRCQAALEESCGMDRRAGGANSCVQCCGYNQLPLRAVGCDSGIQNWWSRRLEFNWFAPASYPPNPPPHTHTHRLTDVTDNIQCVGAGICQSRSEN
jgi:hypothetical protein